MLAPDEVWTASNGDLIQALRATADLDAVLTAAQSCAIREADVRGMAAADSQTSTAVWLSRTLRLHPGEAKARVATAGMLTGKARETGAALLDGKLNTSQARAVAAGLTRIEPHASAEEFAQAEEFLLREGRFLHSGQITRLARHIESVLDPDGEPERRERAFADRAFTITDLGNGRHRIKGSLTDEGAAILKAALDPLAAPRPAVDGQRDPRSPAQRNADALVDLARGYLRFADDLPQSRGARPHVHVTVTAPNLRGDPGHPPSPRLSGPRSSSATSAACSPAARDPRTGPRRTTSSTGLMVERPRWRTASCSAITTTTRSTTAAGRSNRDGHPELIPPPWADPLQRPQRNAHWKLLRDGLKNDEPDRGP